MDDIKSNSMVNRENNLPTEQPRVSKPVVKAERRKRGVLRRFADSLIYSDSENVKSHIVNDVLRPAIGNVIVDAIVDSVRMIFGGDDRRRYDYRNDRYRASRVSYRDYYDDRDRGRDRYDDRYEDFKGYDKDDIVVASRGQAEDVISAMYQILKRYNCVTVADVCELCELKVRWNDNKFGWRDLPNGSVRPVRLFDGRYLIKLPEPRPID